MPTSMKVVRTAKGTVVQVGTASYLLTDFEWDSLFHDEAPMAMLKKRIAGLTMHQGTIHALAFETGASRWTYKTGAEIVAAPIAGADTVYAASADFHIYAIED